MYQILIRNASVIDGTGKPAFSADVAVKDGKIVLNPDPVLGAEEVIDAAGLVLSPGFIDAHCHGDSSLGIPEACLAKSSQGITTECTGQCGETLFPVSTDPAKLDMFAGMFAAYLQPDDSGCNEGYADFTSMKKFLEYADRRQCSTNYTILTGHSPLRIVAMGFDNREATPEELEHMKSLLRECMEQGSKGLSAGLLYSPSCYANEDELVELCKVVAEYDGFFAVHLRDEAGDFENSVKEAIRIAERSGCRLNLSHHKVCGSEFWGTTEKTLKLVEEANARGVKTYVDVYPYLATGNYLNICLPKDFFAHGPEKMVELLKDPAVRAELTPRIKEMDGRYRQCGSFDNIFISSAPKTPECIGMSVGEYARKVGGDEFEVYYDLVCANGHEATAAYFSMCAEDLERVLLHPLSVICTDSFDIGPDKACHPRCFGSFPLCLGKYVREQKLMPLETMIHKMTQALAEFMGIANKGVIADGYDADLVLFNPDTVIDKADFKNSHTLSEGIERVFVAGETVFTNGKLTGKFPGKFIPHQK